jgi:integrase
LICKNEGSIRNVILIRPCTRLDKLKTLLCLTKDSKNRRHFIPALGRGKSRQVSFHSLRQPNTSMRILANQNIKYLSQQLGHSSIQITLDVYGHLFNDVDFNQQQVGPLEDALNSVRKWPKIGV